jgi:hypothetical protein
MTAIWEQALDEIEAGRLTLDAFVAKQANWIAQLIEHWARSLGNSVETVPAAPFATPQCSSERANQGRSGHAPGIRIARALCQSVKIRVAHDVPWDDNHENGAFSALTSSTLSAVVFQVIANGDPRPISSGQLGRTLRVRAFFCGIHSRFVLDLIVVADDHCCLYQAIAVIRFGDRIQSRSPPGKHWAPFVRGCVPACSDPGHDKGRLANHCAVQPSFARSLSTA